VSGIAVIWNRSGGPIDRAHLARMTRLMEHRGPDGEAHWFQESIGLGHRALNTTPEASCERLPRSDDEAGTCLTFDGRIDNRDDLQSQLDLNGAGGRQVTDAELVLAAYRKWGEECPSHLLGDFALVIWDERRKQLFCARDPLGVRPLFYALVGDTFVCASEVLALFALPGLKKEPDLAIVTARLLRKCIEFDDTLYKGVSRLPMAHCLTVSRDRIRQRRYWDIDPGREIRYRSDREYAEHFRELFLAAVGARLRRSAPIAAMLSGGLDSSGIVCAAQHLRRKQRLVEPPLETFSMVFDRFSSCDERPFINEVVRHSGAKANFHLGDSDLGVAAIAHQDRYPGLLYSPHAMVLGAMLDRIKHEKFRVLLDGTGGDELAGSGMRHLVALMRRGQWLSLSALVAEYADTYKISPWRLFLDSCVRPSIPPTIKAVYRRLRTQSSADAARPSLVREDAMESTGARERMTHLGAVPAFSSVQQSEMYSAIFSGWGPTVLAESYELLVSYFGLEMRQPFRDRRLVEFAFAVPSEQLWRDGWSRVVFRNALKELLPEKVLRRRGKGMFLPVYDSVLAGSQAREVSALLSQSILVKLGLADPLVLEDLVKSYQISPDISSTLVISDLVALELICREILGEPALAA
jgi:asparagine synthase (glutamine-hydrolysing)